MPKRENGVRVERHWLQQEGDITGEKGQKEKQNSGRDCEGRFRSVG